MATLRGQAVRRNRRRACIALLLISLLSFLFYDRREVMEIYETWDDGEENLINDNETNRSCTKSRTVSIEVIGDRDLSLDATVLSHFTPPLMASCPYYGVDNGLFAPNTPRPRYIVTGGAGFVGSHLVKALVKKLGKGRNLGQVKVVDNFHRGRLANLQMADGAWAIDPKIDFCALDLRNREDTFRYIRGADVVFHLADVSSTHDSCQQSHDVLQVKKQIHVNTLWSAIINRIPTYISTGTLFTCDDSRSTFNFQFHPEYPETVHQLSSENDMTVSKQVAGPYVGIAFLLNIYGPNDDHADLRGQSLVSSLIHKAVVYPMESFPLPVSRKFPFGFLYVDDAIAALFQIESSGLSLGTMYVGHREAPTVGILKRKVYDAARKLLAYDVDVRTEPCLKFNSEWLSKEIVKTEKILKWSPRVSLDDGVMRTMKWVIGAVEKRQALVIVTGELQGSELAWNSLFKNLIKPHNAHLATFFTANATRTVLQQFSQFEWEVPEAEDWGKYLDDARNLCQTGVGASKWRELCDIKTQWLGGVNGCDHPDKAGSLLAFRWLVQQKVLELNLHRQYDYLVFTRPDYLYLCEHESLAGMSEGFVWSPVGEGYGGISHRHFAARPSAFIRAVNVTQELVCDPERWHRVLRPLHPKANLEKVQAMMWRELKLPVREYRRSMILVNRAENQTVLNDLKQPLLELFGILLKYPAEFTLSMRTCKLSRGKLVNVLKDIQDYKIS